MPKNQWGSTRPFHSLAPWLSRKKAGTGISVRAAKGNILPRARKAAAIPTDPRRAIGQNSTGNSSSKPRRGCQPMSVVYRSRITRGRAQKAAKANPNSQVPAVTHQVRRPDGIPEASFHRGAKTFRHGSRPITRNREAATAAMVGIT